MRNEREHVDVIPVVNGKPFMTPDGIVGYSSVTLMRSGSRAVLFDCGQRGTVLQIRAGLRETGLTPDDIDTVVISHFHFDHVGNLPLFQNAEVLFSETEWTEANEHPDEWHCRQTLSFLRERGHYRFIKEGDEILPCAAVLSLPGHTKGQIGLLVNGDEVLTGDAVKNRYEYFSDIPLMSIDPEESRRTIQKIRTLARIIYPGHDAPLYTAQPVLSEVPVTILYADGTRKEVK